MQRICVGACLLVLSLLFCFETGVCGELSRIKLTDGSVIAGKLVSVNDGIYTIETTSLGTVEVQSSDVASVSNQAVKKKAASVKAQASAGDLSVLQQKLMGNEEVMNMIFSLQNDPDIQKALNDPEFMRAVNSMDLNALQANPLFNNILQNPTIKQIKEKSGK